MALVRSLVSALVEDQVRSLVGFEEFDPASLFANGEQGALYEPWDLTTLYQDSAGTTPVTADGDPVGLMLDKSGNGNHASQATSASRPVYRTDGTLHWLEFDGVDDIAVLPDIPAATQDRMSIHAILASSPDGAIWSAKPLDALGWDFDLINVNEFYPNTRSSDGSYIVISTGINVVGMPVVTSTYVSGSTFSARVNKGAEQSVSFTPNAPVDWTSGRIFGKSGSVSLLSGRYYGGVLLFSAQKDAEKTIEYLAQKAGVTL